MTEIYLATLQDRHISDEHKAFHLLEDAIKQCQKWKKSYEGQYRFRTPTDWNWKEYWEFYQDAGDDCPKVMIKKLELT